MTMSVKEFRLCFKDFVERIEEGFKVTTQQAGQMAESFRRAANAMKQTASWTKTLDRGKMPDPIIASFDYTKVENAMINDNWDSLISTPAREDFLAAKKMIMEDMRLKRDTKIVYGESDLRTPWYVSSFAGDGTIDLTKDLAKSLTDAECDECYGSGFWRGMGAPCSRGCRP